MTPEEVARKLENRSRNLLTTLTEHQFMTPGDKFKSILDWAYEAYLVGMAHAREVVREAGDRAEAARSEVED